MNKTILYILVWSNRDGDEIIEVWDDEETAFDRCDRYNQGIDYENNTYSKILHSIALKRNYVYVKEMILNEKRKV
jgi:hypothetical protein